MSIPSGLHAEVIDELPAEVAVLDDTGEIVYTNERWRDFGRENGLEITEGTEGVNYLSVTESASDDRYAQTAAEGIRALLAGERREFEFEYPCHSPDEKRWFMMSAKRIRYRGSTYVFVGHVNITGRRLAEERVREQNRQLQTVADILAHDLRNPLGIVDGYVDQLAAVDGVEPRTVDRIESALGRAEQIISDALVLARETSVENPVLVDLEQSATSAWKNVETKDATLTVTGTIHFEADEGLLLSLFENLYRNAGEHAGPAVAVEIGPLPDGEGFYVQDTGPGIPAQIRDDLFEAGTMGGDGTGLGLAIVRTVVDAHGWEISVNDDDTGGARFEISALTVR